MPIPRSRLLGALAAGLAILAAAWALGPGRAVTAESVTVQAAPLVRSVVVAGRVASESRVFLGSTVTGRVSQVRVREGAPVRAGELLVQLEDAEARAALQQAQAALAGAQARLDSQRGLTATVAEQQWAQARANAEAASAELQRHESLFRQGFIGQARLDEVRRTATVAASQRDAAQVQAQANARGPELAQALSRVAEARAVLELARSRLALTRIVAPADGTVLARAAEPGQIVQPGARLLEMSLAGPVLLVAQVDERYLSQLAVGQQAAVVADAFPGQALAARVTSIAPGVDAQRGAVEVKLAPASVPAFLKSDMTLSIEIVTARREQALVLPAQALRAGSKVLVAEDGRAVEREVRAGIRTLEAVEIVDGLRAGQTVLTDPRIAPGQRVRAVPAAPRSRADGPALGEGLNSAIQAWGR